MKPADERLNEQWNRSFAELQAWVTKAGVIPSRRSSEADEYRLANWLNRQRTDARNEAIDPERERKLRTIPRALEPQQRRLSDVDLAKRLKTFHAEHGRLPRQRAGGGESTMASYLSRLRSQAKAGTLSPDAASAFSAIPGAQGDRRPYGIDDRLEMLSEYLAEHGHLPPWNDNGLYGWLWRALRGEASTNAEEAARARTTAQTLTADYARRPKAHGRTCPNGFRPGLAG